MKKVLALALALAVCIAGTSIAAPRKSPERHPTPARMNQEMPPRMNQPAPARMERMNPDAQNTPCNEAPCPPKARRGSRIFTPDMPKEIREKAAELAKLRIDLEEAMTSRPINKEKALDVHAKIQKAKQEIETWRFTRRLERIEARQKKGLPPAPEDMNTTQEEETETPENAAPENESKE